MLLAQKVKDIIENHTPECFSLYAGYGMMNGDYVRFPQGVMVSESRNTKGRCIKAAYKFSDNSVLCYAYSEKSDNYTLKVQ